MTRSTSPRAALSPFLAMARAASAQPSRGWREPWTTRRPGAARSGFEARLGGRMRLLGGGSDAFNADALSV